MEVRVDELSRFRQPTPDSTSDPTLPPTASATILACEGATQLEKRPGIASRRLGGDDGGGWLATPRPLGTMVQRDRDQHRRPRLK